MSDQGLPIIDRTVQETNRWLNALMEDTGESDKTFALAGLRGVLVTLRDTMPVDLATNLGDQLPLLVRGIYYENYVPAKTPHLERTSDDWAASVAATSDTLDAATAMTLSRARSMRCCVASLMPTSWTRSAMRFRPICASN